MNRHINPANLGAPHGYTHVVETRGARTAYISGQVAEDVSGNVIGERDFEAQTRQVFQNLERALAAVGATFADVAKTTTYVLDMSQIQILREIRAGCFGETPPANTLVEVRALAHPGYLIEIDAVAVLDE